MTTLDHGSRKPSTAIAAPTITNHVPISANRVSSSESLAPTVAFTAAASAAAIDERGATVMVCDGQEPVAADPAPAAAAADSASTGGRYALGGVWPGPVAAATSLRWTYGRAMRIGSGPSKGVRSAAGSASVGSGDNENAAGSSSSSAGSASVSASAAATGSAACSGPGSGSASASIAASGARSAGSTAASTSAMSVASPPSSSGSGI